MSVTPSVLIFAFSVAIAAGIVCSLPAIVHLYPAIFLRQSGGILRERSANSAQHSSGVLRGSLVVSELALALVLLSGAGLMVGSFSPFSEFRSRVRSDECSVSLSALP